MYEVQAKRKKKGNSHHLNLTQNNVDSGCPTLASSLKMETPPEEIHTQEDSQSHYVDSACDHLRTPSFTQSRLSE